MQQAQQTRKLSEILPIVREHLITSHDSRVGSIFICYAAGAAQARDQITEQECLTLETRINMELCGSRTLLNSLIEQGKLTINIRPYPWKSYEYIAARDAWLNELQERLEAEGK